MINNYCFLAVLAEFSDGGSVAVSPRDGVAGSPVVVHDLAVDDRHRDVDVADLVGPLPR